MRPCSRKAPRPAGKTRSSRENQWAAANPLHTAVSDSPRIQEKHYSHWSKTLLRSWENEPQCLYAHLAVDLGRHHRYSGRDRHSEVCQHEAEGDGGFHEDRPEEPGHGPGSLLLG